MSKKQLVLILKVPCKQQNIMNLKVHFLLFFTDCPIPVDIQNANKLYDGLTNGSHTLYSCARGYTGSSHDSMALCVNRSWTTHDLYCEGKSLYVFFSVGT